MKNGDGMEEGVAREILTNLFTRILKYWQRNGRVVSKSKFIKVKVDDQE